MKNDWTDGISALMADAAQIDDQNSYTISELQLNDPVKRGKQFWQTLANKNAKSRLWIKTTKKVCGKFAQSFKKNEAVKKAKK